MKGNFMKTVFALVFAFGLQAFAGQVYSLQPGQTLPLSNGDVVACMGAGTGPAPAPQVTVTCTLYTGMTSTNGVSLPPFKGTATASTEDLATQEAQSAAQTKCRNYSAGMSFILDGRYVDPCSDTENIPGWINLCK
jgi:hypothetical protein